MSNRFSQVKWLRLVLTALVVSIVGFVTVFLNVTGYATYLGFQARGVPDPTLIAAFADQYAPWIGAFSTVLFTLLGALHVARRVDAAAQLHGILLGVLVSVLGIILSGTLALDVLITAVLTVGAGWLGATIAGRRQHSA